MFAPAAPSAPTATTPPTAAPATSPADPDAGRAANPHSGFDDAQAILIGTLLVASGVVLFKSSGLLTGGTAGLTFLLHYASGTSFGLLYALLNLPFFWLAWRRLGKVFVLKTLIAIALFSLFVDLAPLGLRYALLEPLLAAVLGGFSLGVGFLILFRHQASLGGFNILALYLQDRYGWPAGKCLQVIDTVILLAALSVVPWAQVAISLLGIAALNSTLAINHRKGRYISF